ncbi:MAG: tRNA (N(6)-L-threonylcarbamoyladenosine(37)-C(2))-methylthiotransferase MtaB [Lachnospiraceae bacterium]|nr:tRNA (N(6)-L-threonylcarbamoyladenosine(37)-C(2))-methylthiotransferase MtaB [Lachnospiraceae bacterium]
MKNKDERTYSVAIINLGCKVNKYEADSMKHKLSQAGFLIVETDDVADIYIVNTCSVTNIAERKSRQMLRRAKRRNPEAVVVATGCYVNADHDNLVKEDYIDIVVGNNCKKNIVEIINEHLAVASGDVVHNSSDTEYIDINKTKEYEEMGCLEGAYLDHKRAYIKVQDGCNQFCSYCIIPYTRGRVRSREKDSILKEIKRLADDGVKEFVLTGIHVSSYGTDFEGDYDLASLICDIADIDNVARIRLSSLEPRIITEDFLERISKIDKLCPHFHLSLQSACNETLKRMNRKYSIEEYMDKCELIRKYYDRPALTTDVIVGFPGESEKEFETTYANLEKIRFYEIHVFKYSPRRGTVASNMEEQVPEDIKNERSDRLLDLTARQKQEYIDALNGIEDEVLLEETVEGDDNMYTGYSKRYVRVSIPFDKDMTNEIIGYTF